MKLNWIIETTSVGSPAIYLVKENNEEKKTVFSGNILEVKAWIDLQSRAVWI